MIVVWINLTSSLFLCGLIWTIQVVHYPMFIHFKRSSISEIMAEHRNRISWIVVPVMFSELFSSVWLSLFESSYSYFHRFGLILVVLIWAVTFFIHVPLHRKLGLNFLDSDAVRLVQTNWIRTVLWSFKALLTLLIFWYMMNDIKPSSGMG